MGNLTRLGVSAGLVLSIFGTACDRPDQAKEKREASERRAQFEADDEAERALFIDPVKADAEIERRLAGFISAEAGLLVVKEVRRSDPKTVVGWHVLPLSTPWHASCVRGRLEFSIGPQDNEGGDVIRAPRLARVRLADAQCERLVLTVGRTISRMALPPR